MSIKIEALTAPAPETIGAIGLAYQLGELPLDLRRRGIPAVRDAEGNRLRLAAPGTSEDYSIQYENPATALERLSRGEDVRIVGLALQYRRETILVRADSPRRTVADLRGARLGIAVGGRPEDEIRKREAARNVDIALTKAGSLPEELEWVELRGAEVPAGGRLDLQALLRGEADAIFAEGALAAEARRLLGVRELEEYVIYAPAMAVLTVSGGLVRERPEWADRILAHASAASSWAYENRKEANRLAARLLGLPEEEVESVFSERLHRQLGISVAEDKWARLVYWKRELLALGALERDFPLDEALDKERIQGAQALLDGGEIELPQSEPISDYAERDLPRSFFFERGPARVLRDDEEALEAARAFAEEIRPGASERDRRRKLPLEEMRRLAELGLLGLVVPQAYGGPDVSTRTLVEIFKLISHADGAIGQIPQNHHFFVKAIELVGSEEQKRFFFGEALKGAQFGNALAERGGGKGAKRLSATIRPAADGDGYELSGSKYYSTGALYAHWIPVTALDEEERRMTAFVPRHAPGVTVLDDWSGIGQRTTASGSVILREVRVPELHLFSHWKIFEGPQLFSAFGQIMHAAVDLGIAQAALEDAAAFVREHTRPAYGNGAASAAEEPDLIRRFGELGIRLQAGEALLDRAADAVDAARAELNAETAGRAALTVDSAKWLITETAVEIANALFEVAGTSSMDRKHNYDRHWRNVRIHTLHDPARLKLHHVGKWFLNGVYHEYKV
ncbi:SfnB family sulfur acquisition oxidoreductase [Cohnella cellulosilytica]|uniref:Dibenzothiophene monooxygenase n=1 Tax=Cohnella cellulosilytica TaxID=986710 RepID=A0ABW2FD09_9BACL